MSATPSARCSVGCVNRETRIAVIGGAAVLFGIGLVLGLALGRTGEDEAAPIPSPVTPSTAAVAPSSVVVTPTPGEAPAISSRGAVLQEGDRTVVAAPSNAACVALIAAGTLGDCDDVAVAGQRVVWVVEQARAPTGATAFSVGVLTFVPDEGGWVRWLEASDPAGERWGDVNVLASDLTSDGVPELLVGFRSTGEADVLEYDIVGYDGSAVPEVLAHPDGARKGSVIVSGGTVQDYSAQYPNDEPVCCPPTFLRRTIAFQDGFFRTVGSETVATTAVPPSQL
jgi:hypothetical protein